MGFDFLEKGRYDLRTLNSTEIQMPQIYGLYDPSEPRAPCIRYVGYTGFLLSRRVIEHVSDAVRGRQNHRCNWIRSLLERDVQPEAVVLEEVSESNWQERERHWIALLRAQLTNTTDGGEGLVNPTQDIRDRISAKVSTGLKGNSRRKGKPHSEADRQKISEGLKSSAKFKAFSDSLKGVTPVAAILAAQAAWISGKKRSPEDVEKMRQRARGNTGRLGKPLTAEHGAKIAMAQLGNKRTLGMIHTKDSRRKISESKIGKRWITNGVESKHLQGDVIPEGWRLGRTQRKKDNT